jgi:hypothetical protein
MFISCGSHRARDKVQRIIGNCKSYYSLKRYHNDKGILELSDSDFEKVKGIAGVKKVIDKGDFHACWSFKQIVSEDGFTVIRNGGD